MVLAQSPYTSATSGEPRDRSVERIPSEPEMRVCRLALAVLPFVPALPALPVVLAAQIMNTGGGRPSVSPDGQWITYSAARNGEWDVYAIHPDGSGDRRVTNVAERNFVNLGPPTWIGNRVLVFQRVNDTTHLSLVDLPGSPAEAPIPSSHSV